MKKLKKLVFILLAVILTARVSAHERRVTATDERWIITGRVIDSNTGEALEYVNVLLFSANDSVFVSYTTTEVGGFFTIEHNATGDYYIETGSLGYVQSRVSLPALVETQRNISLGDVQIQPSQHELSELQVTGRRRQVVYNIDRRVIEASGFLSAAGGTAIDILSQTPSFRVDAEGDITFRGSSGFRVYINGRPSSLSGTMALEQISAGQIENIEVITTPSARHDADGTAGIINIITRNVDVEGWSGMVNLMGSTALSRSFDFLTSIRKNNYRWHISGEYSKRFRNSDFDQVKTITSPQMTTTNHSFGTRERYTDLYTLRSGIDLYRGNTDWIFSAEGGYRNRWGGGDLKYEDEFITLGGVETFQYYGNDYVNLYEYFLRADVGFRHRFAKPGHTLSGSIYGLFDGDAMERFETNLYNIDRTRAQGHWAEEYEYRFTTQLNIDYNLPLSKPDSKFEAGYQFFSYTEDGAIVTKFYDPDPSVQDFILGGELYNSPYIFRRDIHALYAIHSNVLSQFSYQLGLRGEYTHRSVDNVSDYLSWARHSFGRFEMFPSVHLALAHKNDGRTSLAYSRRITQPQLHFVEPYVVYVDHYTAQRGNPEIKPEFTNSVELGYNKNFNNNNSFYSGLFYRMRRDKVERLRVPYHVSGITLDSMANVGKDFSSGAEMAITLQLKSWWTLDINGSLYHYKVKNEYRSDGQDQESVNWLLAVNNNFDVARNTRIRLEAYYVGPSVSTQGRVEDFFYMNMTVRQHFLNRRLIVGLSARDILATAKYNNTLANIDIGTVTKIVPQSPVLTLTMTYNFNNYRAQQREERVSHDLFEGTNR